MNSPLKFLKPFFRLLAVGFRFSVWWIAFSGLCIYFTPDDPFHKIPQLVWIITGGAFAFLTNIWQTWIKNHK